MKKVIICDLDNTLFDSRCMDKYFPEDVNSREGWNEFHKHYSECTRNNFVWMLLHAAKLNWSKIIFLTGREDKGNVRKITEEAIRKMNFTNFDLIMRDENDYRPSHVVKLSKYVEHIKRKYKVDFAIDDDPNCIDMWDKCGINTLQVRIG